MLKRVFNLLKNIPGKIQKLPPLILVPSLLVLFVMAGVGAFFGLKGYNYMQDNPNFCRSCHTMETAWNRWSTSEHRTINCHSCHETNIIEGTEQLIKFSLNRPEQVGKHAAVTDEACEKCHASNNPKWKQVGNTSGHIVHAEEQNISCVKCHAVSIHRFAPPQKICEVCHEGRAIAVTAMASQHCSTCHGFLKPAENNRLNGHGLLPDRETCLACHAAMKVTKVTWPEDAPMKVDCLQCHKPHKGDKPAVACLSCHTGEREKGLHQAKAHAGSSCQTCHKPHEWVVKSRDNCLLCHQNKVEHNAGVLCSKCHDFKGVKR